MIRVLVICAHNLAAAREVGNTECKVCLAGPRGYI